MYRQCWCTVRSNAVVVDSTAPALRPAPRKYFIWGAGAGQARARDKVRQGQGSSHADRRYLGLGKYT